MDAEVSTLSTTTLPATLSSDPSVPETKEPTVNGLPYKSTADQVETLTERACDSSVDNASILTFKEDCASNATANKSLTEIEKEKATHPDEELASKEAITEEGSQVTKDMKATYEEAYKEPEKTSDEPPEDEEDEEGDNDEADDEPSLPPKIERPKRDVPRRSVFEMLQSEINEDDDEYGDDHDMAGDVEDDDVVLDNGKGKRRRKRKMQEIESELNLDGLGDDDDDDVDFSADGLQKKASAKKKVPSTKKEEKALVLFDDDDLPLKGKRSGGRPRKKKTDDEEAPSEDDWHLTGRIKGKLFHDEDDDHENDIDDYAYRQQILSEKKVLTSSNKRSFDGSSKGSKKIKIDVQGWKFSKPRDGMDSKPKSKLSSGMSAQIQTLGHHGSGTSSNVPASRLASDDYRIGSRGLQDDELRRKQSIMTIWEQKLRHLDKELEERVAVIRRNEGKVHREERRLKEYEAVLACREKLLSNCEEFVSSGNEDVAERMSCMKKEYEKFRRLAEEHKKWIEQEHRKIEAHALGRSFDEEDSTPQNRREVTNDLPSVDLNFQEETNTMPSLHEQSDDKAAEDEEDSKAGKTSTNPKEAKVDG